MGSSSLRFENLWGPPQPITPSDYVLTVVDPAGGFPSVSLSVPFDRPPRTQVPPCTQSSLESATLGLSRTWAYFHLFAGFGLAFSRGYGLLIILSASTVFRSHSLLSSPPQSEHVFLETLLHLEPFMLFTVNGQALFSRVGVLGNTQPPSLVWRSFISFLSSKWAHPVNVSLFAF